MSNLVIDDGGRQSAGYKGEAGDCAVRSVAIATGRNYKEVYQELFDFAGKTPRDGYSAKLFRQYMESIGWSWTPTMTIGSGCRVHLHPAELPSGRIIARVTRHFVAVINGVVHDTHDPSRGGNRCVYGYYRKKEVCSVTEKV